MNLHQGWKLCPILAEGEGVIREQCHFLERQTRRQLKPGLVQNLCGSVNFPSDVQYWRKSEEQGIAGVTIHFATSSSIPQVSFIPSASHSFLRPPQHPAAMSSPAQLLLSKLPCMGQQHLGLQLNFILLEASCLPKFLTDELIVLHPLQAVKIKRCCSMSTEPFFFFFFLLCLVSFSASNTLVVRSGEALTYSGELFCTEFSMRPWSLRQSFKNL